MISSTPPPDKATRMATRVVTRTRREGYNRSMHRPHAVLFDLWGTLISSAGFDPSRGHAAVLEISYNPRHATLEHVMELGNQVVTSLEAREDLCALEFTQTALLRIIGDSLGITYPRGLEETEWVFWQAAMEVSLIGGVRELLSLLAAQGMPMGVISNSSFLSATLMKELARKGVLTRFAFVISSADYGVRKPDPIIFQVALRRLGLPAEQVWFAGDTTSYDIEGAGGAGLFPVAFNPRTPIPAHVGEHAVITRWEQLPALMELTPQS
jgi:putative hydrolase of the HAD superfamily